jgi:hypothetical protein
MNKLKIKNFGNHQLSYKGVTIKLINLVIHLGIRIKNRLLFIIKIQHKENL